MSETDVAGEMLNGRAPLQPPKANRARGALIIEVGGETREIALSIGALSYIREETGIETLQGLSDFASDPPLDKVHAFVRAVLHGNGLGVDEDKLARLPVMDAVGFIHALIAAAGDARGDAGNGIALSL